MLSAIFESDRYKLLSKLPDSQIDQVQFSDNGMAFIRENHAIKQIGCVHCYNAKIGQNNLGFPTIAGRQMLGYEEVKLSSTEQALEVLSNLWFCPWCEKMHTEMLPRFI